MIRWSKSSPPRNVSPLVDSTSNCFSPSIVAYQDGVVRAPSLFSITLVVLPSMIATHEFVVPRSMPMILAMFFSGMCGFVGCEVRLPGALSSWCADGDERRPQHAVGDEIALLQDGDDRVRLLRL